MKCKYSNIEQLSEAIVARMSQDRRFIVAVAGAPGAGKSTLTGHLQDILISRLGVDTIAVIPMDGFHLDNRILDARGLRAIKGAPQTFDAAGFVAMLERVRADAGEVMVPAFDRNRDLALAGAISINASQRLIIIEGNYLLLDRVPWNEVSSLVDMSVFIEVPFEELERRLIQRWLDHGLSEDMARRRASENDLVNARLVCEESTGAEVFLATTD